MTRQLLAPPMIWWKMLRRARPPRRLRSSRKLLKDENCLFRLSPEQIYLSAKQKLRREVVLTGKRKRLINFLWSSIFKRRISPHPSLIVRLGKFSFFFLLPRHLRPLSDFFFGLVLAITMLTNFTLIVSGREEIVTCSKTFPLYLLRFVSLLTTLKLDCIPRYQLERNLNFFFFLTIARRSHTDP